MKKELCVLSPSRGSAFKSGFVFVVNISTIPTKKKVRIKKNSRITYEVKRRQG